MQYKIQRVTDSIDILELTEEEYERFNSLFHSVLKRRYPLLGDGAGNVRQIGANINKIILTEGPLRAEFIIRVVGPSSSSNSDDNSTPPCLDIDTVPEEIDDDDNT